MLAAMNLPEINLFLIRVGNHRVALGLAGIILAVWR